MNIRSNIIDNLSNLLKVIGFMAFFTLMTGPVWAQSSLKAIGYIASAGQTTINEPLLLLLFGLLLFSVATGIKLKILKG